MPLLKIFVHESLSGGAMAGRDFGRAPVDEGVAMLRAALADFATLPGVEPVALVDGRLVDRFGGLAMVTAVDGDYGSRFAQALAGCDAALVVAPETGGELARLTGAVMEAGKANLGSNLEGIHQAGDKLVFSSIMAEAKIPHPATYPVACFLDPGVAFSGRWVTKPVDGVGAEDVVIRERGESANNPPGGRLAAQEFVDGAAMSACVVSGEGGTVVLSVNRQRFAGGAGLRYLGGEILADAPGPDLERLAGEIKKAIPGLAGFWGLDFVMTGSGPVVIEVNPRLTTSYCALTEALEVSPASAILAAARDEPLGKWRPKRRRRVVFCKDGELSS